MFVALTEWVDCNEMTDEEKEEHLYYKTTGGYLKSYKTLTEAYIDSWHNTTEEDRELTRKLPNFDEDVFEEVFGFNPWRNKTKTIVIDGKSIEISEESYEELKRKLC